MKKKMMFSLLIVLMMSATIVQAKDYSFSWLPNNPSELVEYYKICYGTTPNDVKDGTSCENVGNEQNNGRIHATLYDFPDNTLYFFACFACNSSECSNPTKLVTALENDAINISGEYDGDGMKDNAVTDNGYLMIDFAEDGFNGTNQWDTILFADSYYETDTPYAYDSNHDETTDVAFEDENGTCYVYTDYTMIAKILYNYKCSNYIKVGTFRPNNNTFYLSTLFSYTPVSFGIFNDIPIIGDWDGNTISNIGVWRSSNVTFYLQKSDGTVIKKSFGLSDDIPIIGDWDGDGISNIGVWRSSNVTFYLQKSDGTVIKKSFGLSDDIPLILY